mgnify:FL=1
MDALLAATRNAAELLGATSDVGSIQAGRYADVVAVKGNPLLTTSLLSQVSFVMKGGKVFRENGSPKVAQ